MSGKFPSEAILTSAECIPISVLPHITRLYTDFLALGEQPADSELRQWYGVAPSSNAWMHGTASCENPEQVADVLQRQSLAYGAGELALANIEKLRHGARAVVTGQQVGLFGGPLLTILKAATAIARAREATTATGVEHVPVFWLASEDHDLDEVDQVTFAGKQVVQTLRLGLKNDGQPVGGMVLGNAVETALDQAGELLGFAPVWNQLKECYTPEATLAGAFARLMARWFRSHGLIVMDAAGRDFHAFGRNVLRAALEQAATLERDLLERSQRLASAGYHAQVLVNPGASLLFLLDAATGERQPLRQLADGSWRAGGRSYQARELLALLDEAPERLSPNALLRPVFQDAILPTAAYIGGPAEIAYFAQSATLYERILGRLTPVLPRYSATLLEPAIATILAKNEIGLEQVIEARTAESLAQRMGARAMPIEGKRRLAAVGNAMDAELGVLTGYLASMDASLGRSADVSASKMRYQMNRLRRMTATFEVQKDASLRRHAEAMVAHLYPEGHLQERVIAGAYFLVQGGDALVDRLVEEAESMCLGHAIVRI